MEIGTEAAQFPEKEHINGIAVAVQDKLRLRHWLSDALATRLDLNHIRVVLIHIRLDLIHTRLDLIHILQISETIFFECAYV